MRHILDSLKSEFITINDEDSGKKYVLRTWHALVFAFVVGFLIG